jgi:hypothetical protein
MALGALGGETAAHWGCGFGGCRRCWAESCDCQDFAECAKVAAAAAAVGIRMAKPTTNKRVK